MAFLVDDQRHNLATFIYSLYSSWSNVKMFRCKYVGYENYVQTVYQNPLQKCFSNPINLF